jgi:hypothetical protein
MSSMTLLRTWISDPQCTEHSLHVLGTTFNSPGADAALDLLMPSPDAVDAVLMRCIAASLYSA